MRSIFRATALALTLGVASAAPTLHAQNPNPRAGKVVFVNSQVLMENAPGRVQAESILTKEGEGYRSQIQKMQDSINKQLAAYQKAEPTLSATAKETRQKELQALETELQANQLKFQQAFNARQSEVMAPVTDLVKRALDDILTEDGYALILDNAPGQSPIVAADKNLDITDRVVSRLRTMKPAAVVAPAATKTGAPAAPAGVQRPTRPPPQ